MSLKQVDIKKEIRFHVFRKIFIDVGLASSLALSIFPVFLYLINLDNKDMRDVAWIMIIFSPFWLIVAHNFYSCSRRLNEKIQELQEVNRVYNIVYSFDLKNYVFKNIEKLDNEWVVKDSGESVFGIMNEFIKTKTEDSTLKDYCERKGIDMWTFIECFLLISRLEVHDFYLYKKINEKN